MPALPDGVTRAADSQGLLARSTGRAWEACSSALVTNLVIAQLVAGVIVLPDARHHLDRRSAVRASVSAARGRPRVAGGPARAGCRRRTPGWPAAIGIPGVRATRRPGWARRLRRCCVYFGGRHRSLTAAVPAVVGARDVTTPRPARRAASRPAGPVARRRARGGRGARSPRSSSSAGCLFRSHPRPPRVLARRVGLGGRSSGCCTPWTGSPWQDALLLQIIMMCHRRSGSR